MVFGHGHRKSANLDVAFCITVGQNNAALRPWQLNQPGIQFKPVEGGLDWFGLVLGMWCERELHGLVHTSHLDPSRIIV